MTTLYIVKAEGSSQWVESYTNGPYAKKVAKKLSKKHKPIKYVVEKRR